MKDLLEMMAAPGAATGTLKAYKWMSQSPWNPADELHSSGGRGCPALGTTTKQSG